MTGPSLSHILDPTRPSPDPTSAPASAPNLFAAPSYPLHPAPSVAQSFNPATAARPSSTPAPSAPRSTPTATTASTPANNAHAVLSLYACGDCGRKYSRPEHLQRHVQTHTLGRRFACSVCGKTFARADLKKRHETNHDNDSSKKRRRTTTSPSAGRVTHACKPCAAARVKCQEDKPCQRCRRRGLTCVAAEAGSSAAMHLVQLSANAHSNPSFGDEPGKSGLSAEYSMPDSAESEFRVQHPIERTSPYEQTPPLHSDSGRLSTPDTMGDTTIPDHLAPKINPGYGGMDHIPFCDFLRDVLYEQQCDHSARMAEGQGLAVLDFCNNSNLELSDMDFGLLDHWNTDGTTDTMPVQQETPETDSSVDIAHFHSLVNAWDVSPWRWNPVANDNAYHEQGNLPVPKRDIATIQAQASKKGLQKVVDQKLDLSARDRVLALVLSACRPDSMSNRISSSFPSTEVMDTMVHIFLNSHTSQVSEWIHFPTFKLDEQEPEWISGAASSGAVLAPVPTLRKFGLALQESVRLIMPNRSQFEANNETILNIGLVQSIILGQETGLWSGNRRKMEIAECHVNIPITMMRYRGKFQRSTYPLIVVDNTDEGAVLEQKWRRWIEMEKWKRLVFHCYLRDSQQSMTALTNPVMSYSELTLPLPAAKELWYAKTAREWKGVYLEREAGQTKRAPSVGDLFHDINLLAANRHRVDVQLSTAIYLHAFWAVILEYRTLCSACKTRSYARSTLGGSSSLLSSRHQQLVHDLQTFQSMTACWPEISAQERLVLNLLMMNLHVSLDDLQLFAGKEGEEQARRIYPVLQQWAESPDSRSAVWFAGQVLRFAKLFPAGQLKNFYAVGVHHAALALWTCGVVTRAARRQGMPLQQETVYLDEPESMALQRYISLGQGRPAIRGPSGRDEASIEDPRASMEAAHEVLKSNFSGGQNAPPAIVENLCILIRQLGCAAWVVGLS
ncbi:hypothetical protein FZEAL_651 [Fusarium zealandicum]|uniref:Transcription factor Pig1p n=1 Tax=Fusarium zealandicum TaxID=1053134 RepID=A0A8H4UUY6_9HYPO|nr:hypothetical protein FZEAL_651 [Fusarium zealandicum]